MLNKYMKCSVSGTAVLYIGPAEVKGQRRSYHIH